MQGLLGDRAGRTLITPAAKAASSKKHHAWILQDTESLRVSLASPVFCAEAHEAASILVQVYSASGDPAWIEGLLDLLAERLPEAVVIGATTVGEIVHGRTLTGTTVVSVSLFASSSVAPVIMPCAVGEELDAGHRLGRTIDALGSDIAGVLLLATPLSMGAADLLRGLSECGGSYPVFGGGAGDYASRSRSFVFQGRQLLDRGVVAAVLCGRDLHVDARNYLGWHPMTWEMTLTEVDGMWVKTVDHAPAFEVYRRYLGIENDRSFFLNALEFPFLFTRNGKLTARVPFAVDDRGALQFVADVFEGETFRLGYGHPTTILAEAADIQSGIGSFQPDAVFLYTCICRRFLMQDDVELETLPFESIAPTIGFYTYGEIFGQNRDLRLLNSTMVAVGIREGPPRPSSALDQGLRVPEKNREAVQSDPYAHQHARVVSRLVHFIGVVTLELEAANRDLKHLSVTDKLTELYNRVMLDEAIKREVARMRRFPSELSLILLDMDHFKRVNDFHGHITGDAVLVNVATVLRNQVRVADTLGRWGGEEFMIVLPHTNAEQARILAEKLRTTVAATPLSAAGPQTCSIGVASYLPGDTEDRLLEKADEALYEAKRGGRNRVVVWGSAFSPVRERNRG